MNDDGAHRIDRTGWPPGPWDDEPDEVVWRFDDLPGYVGLILRNELGGLCGYVGLPPEHPGHGVGWSNNPVLSGLDVHGGITYAGPHMAFGKLVWLVGFDCGHFRDDMPGMLRHLSALRTNALRGRLGVFGEYRTVAYVRAQVESLAKQLAAVDTPAAMELQATPKEEG
jgi:hypothetical protein